MTNAKWMFAVIGILVFLYGLNLEYFSLTNYERVVNLSNGYNPPGDYLLAAVGSLLLMIAGVFISPLYDIIFKNNKFLTSQGARLFIIFLLLLFGFFFTYFPLQEVSVPAIYPVR